MNDTINEYERERREKREKLRALGLDPYGQRTAGIEPLAAIKARYTAEMGHDQGPVVKAAGRVMLKRDMGKLSFMTLRDESGDLQVALDKKRLNDQGWEVRNLIDLGDIISVEGPLGATNKGEVSIWATSVAMASKALLSPPAKHEGLQDVEIRYRQRYVDLWSNPEVMKTLKMRMRIVEEIRAYMKDQGYLEVETPMMQTLAGGAAARPFITHHNALDIPLYMRIAPELFLKRLLVGGFTKVFELNRNFRNEGISPRHNPEFTMLEAYEAFGSWETMADLVEGMICHIAEKLFGGLVLKHRSGRTINLQRPWRRIRMADLVCEKIGWNFQKRRASVDDIRHILDAVQLRTVRLLANQMRDSNPSLAGRLSEIKNVTDYNREKDSILKLIRAEHQHIGARLKELDATVGTAGEQEMSHILSAIAALKSLQSDYVKFIDQQTVEDAFIYKFTSLSPEEQLVEAYEKFIEPTLIDPCFVTHVPSVIIPLARKAKDDPFFADVYELAINGQEISPGYTELNDPDVQAENFAHQVGDEAEKQKVDDDFLNALKFGMPPAGGMGMGIDRLVMMLTGAESIRDVILFPLMKPQG